MAKKRSGHFSGKRGSNKINVQSQQIQRKKVGTKFFQRLELMVGNRQWRQEQALKAKLADAAD